MIRIALKPPLERFANNKYMSTNPETVKFENSEEKAEKAKNAQELSDKITEIKENLNKELEREGEVI